MKFCYKVIQSKCVEIDFQQIYDYIRNEHPTFSLEDIDSEFCDNVEHYLKTLFNADDFVEDTNDYKADDLCVIWTKWLYKNGKI